MLITAFIRPGSSIDRKWNGHNRRAGMVNGVQFNKQGSIYVSGPLTPAEYAGLESHPSVRVEARTAAIEPPNADGALVSPEFRPKAKAKPARK